MTGHVRDGVFRGMLRWERPYGARRQCVVTARFSPGGAGSTLIDLRFAQRAENRVVFVYALVFFPAFLGFSLFRLASPHATRQDLLFPIMGAVIAFMAFGVFAMTRAIARTEQGLITDFLKRTVQAT